VQRVIRKIVSNGRIGVARGALDAALALDIPHGGWGLPGDVREEEPLPEKYNLREMKTKSNTRCIERNVIETEGTLILTFADDMPEDALAAQKSAHKHHVPWILVNLGQTGTFQAAQDIHEWLKEQDIHVVHVVGASTGTLKKKADKTTCSLLEAVYYLGLIESNMTATSWSITDDGSQLPTSVDGIVSLLLTEMSLKDRVIVANMKEAQLELLQPTLGRHIQIRLEYWRQSAIPIALEKIEEETAGADDISALIIKKVWNKLRATHRLRIV
jgi:hypothetical protein